MFRMQIDARRDDVMQIHTNEMNGINQGVDRCSGKGSAAHGMANI